MACAALFPQGLALSRAGADLQTDDHSSGLSISEKLVWPSTEWQSHRG
jgi:hypothetical protein